MLEEITPARMRRFTEANPDKFQVLAREGDVFAKQVFEERTAAENARTTPTTRRLVQAPRIPALVT